MDRDVITIAFDEFSSGGHYKSYLGRSYISKRGSFRESLQDLDEGLKLVEDQYRDDIAKKKQLSHEEQKNYDTCRERRKLVSNVEKLIPAGGKETIPKATAIADFPWGAKVKLEPKEFDRLLQDPHIDPKADEKILMEYMSSRAATMRAKPPTYSPDRRYAVFFYETSIPMRHGSHTNLLLENKNGNWSILIDDTWMRL